LPAAQAGLAAGDLITSLGGQAVDSPATLITVLGRYHPDDRVLLGWSDQSGEQHAATVHLVSGPAA
jgi:S1-C subfamily serine protease